MSNGNQNDVFSPDSAIQSSEEHINKEDEVSSKKRGTFMRRLFSHNPPKKSSKELCKEFEANEIVYKNRIDELETKYDQLLAEDEERSALDETRLNELCTKILSLEELVAAKDGELKSVMDELECARHKLECKCIENEGRSDQMKALVSYVSENHKLKKQNEELQVMVEALKRGLAVSVSGQSVKQLSRGVLFSGKSDVKLLEVSEKWLFFGGKKGAAKEVVIRNIVPQRVAFKCYGVDVRVSHQCGILMGGEQMTLTVRCSSEFFTKLQVISTIVPAGAGEIFQEDWFMEGAQIAKKSVNCMQF